MNRKTLFSLLVLLLVLLAPAMSEARVSADEVIGTMLTRTPSDKDVSSWTRAAGYMLVVYREDGLYGLDAVSKDVLNVLEGRNRVKELDELFPTRLDKIRFLLCDRQWKLQALKHLTFDMEYVEESVARIRAFLVKNVSGYYAREDDLKKVAMLATMFAHDQLKEEGK